MSNPVKADRYVELLDAARCEGNWDAVPEWVRKIRKHAPDRQCLTTTAEIECTISQAQQKQAADRPATALPPEDLDAAALLPKLQAVIGGEQGAQAKFQAEVCVGWIHWVTGNYDECIACLPRDFEQAEDASEWTKVCALRAAWLLANSLSRTSEMMPALGIFESSLPSLSKIWATQKGRKELQFWAEQYLTEYCMMQALALENGDKTLEDPNCLAPFRSWATYWDASKAQGSPLAGGQGFRDAIPRRSVWSEYYNALSRILRQDLAFPVGQLEKVTNDSSAKHQLRNELKKAEAAYESLLLSETPFPRADEDREEVEAFVQSIMTNWEILSGREWTDHDLGADGKEGLSRGVLEILYRAATKTFHSTAILRHLFTVHLAVAEFDLAFKAFDSYLEIVKKGKARVDKTGHKEVSLDDDTTVLTTISAAITALCKYGFQDEAEKAHGLGIELEQMLEKLPAPLPKVDEHISTVAEETGDGEALHPRVPARVNALAWQAIGLSQAQWSRKTYDAGARTEIQAKAIRSFQKSLSPETGNPTDVGTLFTLGLVLAEQRELSAAIDIVKAALMSNKKPGDQSAPGGSYWRERALIPLWHLLALLLSARQDFVLASRACEGAFEQFEDPSVLFGSQNLQGPFRSEHLNEVEAKNGPPSQSRGLIDEMDELEKEGIIEVKMTQLALLELLEGPEVAVNASHELLVLYTRLFGSFQSENSAPPATSLKPATAVPPKSSAGTLRSLRGSVFGTRDKSATRSPGPPPPVPALGDNEKAGDRPQTAVSGANVAAPTIQVTQENGDHSERRSRTNSTGSRRGRGRSESTKRRNSLKKKDHLNHLKRAASSNRMPHSPTVLDGDAYYTPGADGTPNGRPDFFAWSSQSYISSQQSLFQGQGLQRFNSTASSTASPEPLVLESLSAPNNLPMITFPKQQVERQRQSILIKVWLMIAAFYRRAEMYKDCHGALDEARKIVDALEADVAQDAGYSISSRHPGWGGKKSIEELWGDVRSEMAYLSLAEGVPLKARAQFEEALMHFANHPSAIVGLSNVLLDIYGEKLMPPPAIPSLDYADGEAPVPFGIPNQKSREGREVTSHGIETLPSAPLGLENEGADVPQAASQGGKGEPKSLAPSAIETLSAPYKTVSLPLSDRLAARDRAYGLLSGLTKLGSGWNYSDAWFALARAHEESGQVDKAKEALWWCVELEESMGVREWSCIGVGGYVL